MPDAASLLAMLTARGCSTVGLGACCARAADCGPAATHNPIQAAHQAMRATGHHRHRPQTANRARQTRVTCRPETGWDDVAGSMGMGDLPELAWLVAQVKYMGAGDKLRALELRLLDPVATRLVLRHKLQKHVKNNVLIGHVRSAMQEVVGVSRCDNCNGTGYHNQKPCPPCTGSGRIRVSHRRLARRAGCCLSTWQRRWQPLYTDLVLEIEHHDALAQAHVKKYTK